MATYQPGRTFVTDDDTPTIEHHTLTDDHPFVVVRPDGRSQADNPSGPPPPPPLHFGSPEAVMQWAHRLRVAAEDLILSLDAAREYDDHYGPVGFYDEAAS